MKSWETIFGGPIHGERGEGIEFVVFWKIPKITYGKGREEDA